MHTTASARATYIVIISNAEYKPVSVHGAILLPGVSGGGRHDGVEDVLAHTAVDCHSLPGRRHTSRGKNCHQIKQLYSYVVYPKALQSFKHAASDDTRP